MFLHKQVYILSLLTTAKCMTIDHVSLNKKKKLYTTRLSVDYLTFNLEF